MVGLGCEARHGSLQSLRPWGWQSSLKKHEAASTHLSGLKRCMARRVVQGQQQGHGAPGALTLVVRCSDLRTVGVWEGRTGTFVAAQSRFGGKGDRHHQTGGAGGATQGRLLGGSAAARIREAQARYTQAATAAKIGMGARHK